LKTVIVIYFFSLSISCCDGQAEKTILGDTTSWNNWQGKEKQELGLEGLTRSKDKFHFRFSDDDQVVDIWSTDGITYKAMINSFTKTDNYNEKTQQSKPAKLIFRRVFIDSIVANRAHSLIEQVAKIPTDQAIRGWSQGFDGTDYAFEYSTPSTYEFKTYWTPTAQDSSLVEAKKIQSFIVNLDSLLELKSKYREFFKTLRPGEYTNGMIVFTKLTHKQHTYFIKMKPYWAYLDSLKDKLNSYLSDTLTKIFHQYGDLRCDNEFILTFSTDNKLLKVETSDKLDDKNDKLEFRDCRKKIFAAFKRIKIDFVHSKMSYHEGLSISDGQVYISSSQFW
jgi:hypothetical protein